MHRILKELAETVGIHFMGVDPQFQPDKVRLRQDVNGYACDAQPTMISVGNSGIPAFLSTFVDPKLIEVLLAPMKAQEIVGNEIQKGDWTTETAMFQMIEATGQVSTYGDYAKGGRAGVNVNWPQRQSYHYQVMVEYGEKELARAGLAKIDWANQLRIANVMTLNRFQNATYLFGVADLQNYGLLNDPALSAAITPSTKAAGGTTWAVATVTEMYKDVGLLFAKLQTQTKGLIDTNTPMVLVMSASLQANTVKSNEYGVTFAKLIAEGYPNMQVVTVPEYETAGGQVVQLIVPEFSGQRTADLAFTEKLRAHAIVVDNSSFSQKHSQGTWGTLIYRPMFISQTIGV